MSLITIESSAFFYPTFYWTFTFPTTTNEADGEVNTEFFLTEDPKVQIGTFPMERVICSTNTDEANIDYTKAEYRVDELMLKDHVITMFNYRMVEIYGEEYMYEFPEADEAPCYTDGVEPVTGKILFDNSTTSRNCYIDSFTKTVNGQTIKCLVAPVFRKVLMIPRSRAEVEAMLKSYCPSVAGSDGLIDDLEAISCTDGLTMSEITDFTIN